jgi:MFS family permease
LSKGLENEGAFASLIIARVIYAANFYNIAAVFTLIAADLNQNVGGLGLLSSSFLLGISIFQIPAGIYAATAGPKKAAAYGTLLASAAVVLTSVAPTFIYMVLFRFLVGVGMAFVFGPGVALTARYFRRGSEGLSVGIYNSTFGLGSIIGITGWVVLAELFGWRSSLLVGGILGIMSGMMLLLFVPRDPDSRGRTIRFSDMRTILLERKLLLVAAGLIGINASLNLVNTFVVYYLEVTLSVVPVQAALAASLTWVSNIFIALASGRVYDRMRNVKALFLISAAVSFVGMAIIAYPSLYASYLGALMVGGAVGIGSTVAFSVAREAAKEIPQYESLSVSWVNAIQYLGSFCFTLLFSFFALSIGYVLVWPVVGAVIFPLAMLILLIRSGKKQGKGTPAEHV